MCGVETTHLISRHYLRKESPECKVGLLLFILSAAFPMHSQAQVRQPRIPEQQSVGQTLPPVPVGMDTSNAPPLPPGAMPSGSRVQVQKYQVIIHNFLAEGRQLLKPYNQRLVHWQRWNVLRWLCACLHCSDRRQIGICGAQTCCCTW